MPAPIQKTGNNSLLPVESAGAGAEARVKSVKVVGGTNYEETVVAFQTINLVKEEGPVIVSDQAIQILEDKHARGKLTRFLKNLSNGVLVSGVT